MAASSPPATAASSPSARCGTTFTFHGAAPAAVSVAGEFNNWDTTATKLTGPDGKGDWTATVMLAPGAYAYKVVTADAGGALTWQLDPSTPYTKYVGGVENSVVEVDDCKTPVLQFKALTKTADGALHAEVQYLDGSAAAGLDVSSVTVTLDGAPAGGATLDGNGVITVDETGLAKTKHRLIFHADDKAGHAAVDLHVPFWIEDQPFDFRDGLMYFAFTDRFRNGDPTNDKPIAGVDPRANYQGGDYAGTTAAIDEGYFDALGVRTLWLSPPNTNPDGGFVGTGGYLYSGYHGYWPIAGREVQPRFGTLDELKKLVQHAHAHGIRVIIDSVLNHVHQEHPYYQMHMNDWFNPLSINNQQCVCGTGPTDGCGDWNSSQPNGNHGLLPKQTCWFEPYMPDLDYENWDALTTTIDDALFWARDVDVDGFRVDAVKHFLLAATKRLRGKLHDQFEWTGPLFYLVGETFDGDRNLINSFIGPSALDAQFDFPIYFAISDTLATYSQSLRELESRDGAVGHGVRRRADVAVLRQPRRRALPVGGQRRQHRRSVERAAGGADDRGPLLQAAPGAHLRRDLAGRADDLLRRRVRHARRRRSRQPPLHEVAERGGAAVALRAGDARRHQEARRGARGAGGAAPRRSQDLVDRRRPLRLRAHDAEQGRRHRRPQPQLLRGVVAGGAGALVRAPAPTARCSRIASAARRSP